MKLERVCLLHQCVYPLTSLEDLRVQRQQRQRAVRWRYEGEMRSRGRKTHRGVQRGGGGGGRLERVRAGEVRRGRETHREAKRERGRGCRGQSGGGLRGSEQRSGEAERGVKRERGGGGGGLNLVDVGDDDVLHILDLLLHLRDLVELQGRKRRKGAW